MLQNIFQPLFFFLCLLGHYLSGFLGQLGGFGEVSGLFSLDGLCGSKETKNVASATFFV